jgi:hypothetical protein
MTTMRRMVDGMLVVSALLVLSTQAFATETRVKRTPAEAAAETQGVDSVTDGEGRPIDLKPFVLAETPSGAATGAEVQTVKRGRAWWPYATPIPSGVGRKVEGLSEDEIVVNGTAVIDIRNVKASLQLAPKELVLESGSQLAETEGFYLVKLRGFTRTQAEVDALTHAGAVLGEYLNVNTYIAKIPSAAYAAVRALPFVTFVGDYQPAFKISPRIGLEEIPFEEATDPLTGEAKPWVFDVTLHNGVYVNDVLNALAQLQIFPAEDDIVSNDAMTFIRVRTVPDAVPALSMIPGVKFIAEKAYPKLLASATNPATIPMMLQNNAVYTTNSGVGWKLWNAGIDGTGQIVTMMDSGLNTKMEHFALDTITNGTPGAAHRKVVGYDTFGGDQCVLDTASADGGHGTKTSQHAVGSISNMTSNPDVTHTPNGNWDNGIARGAKVYFQDIGLSTGAISPPGDLGPAISTAIGKGSFIQNNSWGAANNSYDTSASNLDTALFANPNFVVTVSAGNRGTGTAPAPGTGTLGSPSTAKNAICVGGNDVSHPDNLYLNCNWDGLAACNSSNDLGSSRGPVSGAGRTKPDIMGFIWSSGIVGDEQMAISRPSAMCQTDPTKIVYFDYDNIGDEGGTSFSAPEVAGLAALVRDYFQKGYYPTGTAVPANALTPAGALVKAIILASGEDMLATAFPTTSVAIGKRYSSDVGYGRANLPAALHVGAGAPFLWVQNNDNVGDGATKTFFYNINGNTTALRVMMTYYDAAGDALQKDADLKVTIGANVYWGNNLSGGWSTSATANRDHTNNTEGVFLDAAHGLPASGTVKVEVIGFNDPGGMNYSLAVVGDVASQLVTQVSLDQGTYTCNDTVHITVNDAAASSPVSVTLVSKNSLSTTIDTKIVSCTGSNGVFTGTIQAGSGIVVADGGSLTATYVGAIAPSVATVTCQVGATDFGLTPSISGGCDNTAAGTDTVNGPLFTGGSNEFYSKYMDAGEASSYTFKFKNTTGVALTDAFVALSFSGAGASKMSVFNSPVHIGFVPVDGVVGGVFQVFTDPSTTAFSSVSMDFDITSAVDGYTAPKRISQAQLLQTNDQITRQASCQTFNASLGGFAESTKVTRTNSSGVVIPTAVNTWHWAGPTQVIGAELRVDGACGDATNNAAAMTGGALTTANFNNNADSVLFLNFQPALRGNGPSGQPYHYAWKWHSFYHATETLANQSGIWTTFYNDHWNSAVAPTGDQIVGFPIGLLPPNFAYPQSVLDYVGTWNWDAANGGTPDDPHFGPSTGGAPNQLIIGFSNVTGLATASTFFAYGHEHADIFFFNGNTSHGTHRDIAIDNDRLVYDEWYSEAQAGASCGGGGQTGQVAFNLSDYDTCPNGSAVLSVVDANGVSGMQVTVTSPGTGDSELVTLTGAGPYFSGTLNLSTNSGAGANNGVLFVLPSGTINASYSDTSPVGTTVATANTGCTGGNVVYLSNAQIADNGDNDGIPDNNETVTMDLTIQNNAAVPLTNTKVTIFSTSPNIDCIGDPQALYGTVGAGLSATNPIGDRFSFHVAPSVACASAGNPPVAQFIVVITGDGVDGPAALQTFNLSLDLDPSGSGGSYTLTQNFNSDPGWTTGITPDDTVGSGCGPYVNDFHWCAACGNGSGGYGAWVGNSPFATNGQNYTEMGSSTLYSPSFIANGNVGLQFSVAYRTETTYDGAIVQYRIGAGTWTNLDFSTPVQAATTNQEFCSPFLALITAWTGVGTSWTTTDTAVAPSSLNDPIQFRWRLGSDSSVVGTNYGGLGVDDVSISNLKLTVACEPTRNSGLPACTFCQLNPVGTGCDDSNACTSGDVCAGGACVGTPITTPTEAQSVGASADKTTFSWTALPNATAYDALHGLLSALPVGPGGGDETCFPNLATPSFVEATTPAPGTGLYILVRGKNACAGAGSYGTQKNGTPRTSTTCP